MLRRGAVALEGIRGAVGGGWAIDGLRGRVSRIHNDIDIVVLSEDRDRLADNLERAGFRSIAPWWPHSMRLKSEDNLTVDLLVWRPIDGGRVEWVGSGGVIRTPIEWLTEVRLVELSGVTFPIPRNEHFRAIAPLVSREYEREYLLSLPVEGSWKVAETNETLRVTLDAIVREYATDRSREGE